MTSTTTPDVSFLGLPSSVRHSSTLSPRSGTPLTPKKERKPPCVFQCKPPAPVATREYFARLGAASSDAGKTAEQENADVGHSCRLALSLPQFFFAPGALSMGVTGGDQENNFDPTLWGFGPARTVIPGSTPSALNNPTAIAAVQFNAETVAKLLADPLLQRSVSRAVSELDQLQPTLLTGSSPSLAQGLFAAESAAAMRHSKLHETIFEQMAIASHPERHAGGGLTSAEIGGVIERPESNEEKETATKKAGGVSTRVAGFVMKAAAKFVGKVSSKSQPKAAGVLLPVSLAEWSLAEDRLLLQLDQAGGDFASGYAAARQSNPALYPKPMASSVKATEETPSGESRSRRGSLSSNKEGPAAPSSPSMFDRTFGAAKRVEELKGPLQRRAKLLNLLPGSSVTPGPITNPMSLSNSAQPAPVPPHQAAFGGARGVDAGKSGKGAVPDLILRCITRDRAQQLQQEADAARQEQEENPNVSSPNTAFSFAAASGVATDEVFCCSNDVAAQSPYLAALIDQGGDFPLGLNPPSMSTTAETSAPSEQNFSFNFGLSSQPLAANIPEGSDSTIMVYAQPAPQAAAAAQQQQQLINRGMTRVTLSEAELMFQRQTDADLHRLFAPDNIQRFVKFCENPTLFDKRAKLLADVEMSMDVQKQSKTKVQAAIRRKAAAREGLVTAYFDQVTTQIESELDEYFEADVALLRRMYDAHKQQERAKVQAQRDREIQATREFFKNEAESLSLLLQRVQDAEIPGFEAYKATERQLIETFPRHGVVRLLILSEMLLAEKLRTALCTEIATNYPLYAKDSGLHCPLLSNQTHFEYLSQVTDEELAAVCRRRGIIGATKDSHKQIPKLLTDTGTFNLDEGSLLLSGSIRGSTSEVATVGTPQKFLQIEWNRRMASKKDELIRMPLQAILAAATRLRLLDQSEQSPAEEKSPPPSNLPLPIDTNPTTSKVPLPSLTTALSGLSSDDDDTSDGSDADILDSADFSLENAPSSLFDPQYRLSRIRRATAWKRRQKIERPLMKDGPMKNSQLLSQYGLGNKCSLPDRELRLWRELILAVAVEQERTYYGSIGGSSQQTPNEKQQQGGKQTTKGKQQQGLAATTTTTTTSSSFIGRGCMKLLPPPGINRSAIMALREAVHFCIDGAKPFRNIVTLLAPFKHIVVRGPMGANEGEGTHIISGQVTSNTRRCGESRLKYVFEVQVGYLETEYRSSTFLGVGFDVPQPYGQVPAVIVANRLNEETLAKAEAERRQRVSAKHQRHQQQETSEFVALSTHGGASSTADVLKSVAEIIGDHGDAEGRKQLEADAKVASKAALEELDEGPLGCAFDGAYWSLDDPGCALANYHSHNANAEVAANAMNALLSEPTAMSTTGPSGFNESSSPLMGNPSALAFASSIVFDSVGSGQAASSSSVAAIAPGRQSQSVVPKPLAGRDTAVPTRGCIWTNRGLLYLRGQVYAFPAGTATYEAGDTLTVALDETRGTVSFYKNGRAVPSPVLRVSTPHLAPPSTSSLHPPSTAPPPPTSPGGGKECSPAAQIPEAHVTTIPLLTEALLGCGPPVPIVTMYGGFTAQFLFAREAVMGAASSAAGGTGGDGSTTTGAIGGGTGGTQKDKGEGKGVSVAVNVDGPFSQAPRIPQLKAFQSYGNAIRLV